MIRFLVFLLAISAAAYGGYKFAPTAEPAPAFVPQVIEVTACTPKAVIGYVLVLPDGYVGGLTTLSTEDRARVNALAADGAMRLGTIHFTGRTACPGV